MALIRSEQVASLSTEQHRALQYKKQFEINTMVPYRRDPISWTLVTCTLPACTRTLVRKGVECAAKAVEKKVEKTEKPKLPKGLGLSALKF